MELAELFDQVLRQLHWGQVHSGADSVHLPCPESNPDHACSPNYESTADHACRRAHASPSGQCLLRACLEPDGSAQSCSGQDCLGRVYLSGQGRAHIGGLVRDGWTLRSRWPRAWCPSIDRWIGRRLVLGHASLFAAHTRLISLVSSRLGRHGSLQPDWPHWLDGALRYAQRQRERLLIVPETTLAATVEHFARVADLPRTTLRCSAQSDPSEWLCSGLSSLASPARTATGWESWPGEPLESLWLSPPLQEPEHNLQTLPLQDRLSLALADSVLALSIRAAGNLERLVAQRLQDSLFPPGSVFVTLPRCSVTLPGCGATQGSSSCGAQERPSKPPRDWLRQGAVGWVASQARPSARSPLSHCAPVWPDAPPSATNHPVQPPKQSTAVSVWPDAPPSATNRSVQPPNHSVQPPKQSTAVSVWPDAPPSATNRPVQPTNHPVQPPKQSTAAPVWPDAPPSATDQPVQPLWQLTCPLPAHWRQLAADDAWPYLVHCTRGTVGPFPEESLESFRERVWLRGDAVALQPLETLARICRERRLRSTCGITRTATPCVSFSAVPLVPLLRRRTFQAHLGRWDWEPYGLLICLQPLIDAGAAPVIYGSQAEFLKLPTEKQPLFQPDHRKSGKSHKAAWTEEREWRVLHDVDLRSLPLDSVRVFTRTRREAEQLAQHAAWPVLWAEPEERV